MSGTTATSRRLASPAVKAILRRRMAETAGLVLALLGLALAVALVSHDPQDPSLNTAEFKAAAIRVEKIAPVPVPEQERELAGVPGGES